MDYSGSDTSKSTYPWKRFWQPFGEELDLDNGYLPDPEQWGRYHNPTIVAYEDIDQVPCLILTGEPEIGKTTALKASAHRSESDGQLKWINLEFSDSGLDVLNDELYRRLRQGGQQLKLFIDHVGQNPGLIDPLFHRLCTMPPDVLQRISLRLICRPPYVDLLQRRWRDLPNKREPPNPRVYKLAPLRRADVVVAARTRLGSDEPFLAEVEQKEVLALATRPVTLRLLMTIYEAERTLPSSRVGLYLKGCLLLCTDTSSERQTIGPPGKVPPEQRLAVASRIAAVTTFGNYPAILAAPDFGDAPNDLKVSDLVHGLELTASSESLQTIEPTVRETFEATELTVRETLNTALFSLLGSERYGWTHQTYREFLAVLYLQQHRFKREQIVSLLTYNSGGEIKSKPEMSDIVGWAASMIPGMFEFFADGEPQALLRAHLEALQESQRIKLTASLLSALATGKPTMLHSYPFGRLRELAHPELVAQLKPYIADKGEPMPVRVFAVDLAKACQLKATCGDLVMVALDDDEPQEIRAHAAWTVSEIGDDDDKERLRSLADSPHDELKGAALNALWPDHMSCSKLLSHITPPRGPAYDGRYRRFLARLAETLEESDLCLVLRWVAEQTKRTRRGPIRSLAKGLLIRAWHDLDSDAMVEAFTSAVFVLLQDDHGQLFSHSPLTTPDRDLKAIIQNDGRKRRMFLERLVPMVAASGKHVQAIALGSIIEPDSDFAWLIGKVSSTRSEPESHMWVSLIRATLRWDCRNHMRLLLPALVQRGLRAVFPCWKVLLFLCCPSFLLLLRKWRTVAKRKTRSSSNKPRSSLRAFLARLNVNDLSSWVQICNEAIRHLGTGSSRASLDPVSSDFQRLPDWQRLRGKVCAAARTYISNGRPTGVDPGPPLSLQYADYLGYVALSLLLAEDPDYISQLTNGAWVKWVQTIVAVGVVQSEGDGPYDLLILTAYQRIACEAIQTLETMMDMGLGREVRHHVDVCWDDRMAAFLSAKLRDGHLNDASFVALLEVLIEHGDKDAAALAASLVHQARRGAADTCRAEAAARILLTQAQDSGWPVIGPTINDNADFGRRVIDAVAELDWDRGHVPRRLSPDQAADLYVWLVQNYPYPADPQRDGDHSIGPREKVERWRNLVLGYLRDLGTEDACCCIRRIMAQCPELDFLSSELLDAEENARRAIRQPPSAILRMASDQDARLVCDAQGLVQVITESLRRLQDKLGGDPPYAEYLWNEPPRDQDKCKFRPKGELLLAAFISGHLDDDLRKHGVVVNREVTIGYSKRTDIQVDAVARRPHESHHHRVTVIIEVKGCWNPELRVGMKTQLVDRYLKSIGGKHGIYLVGWYVCNRWDDGDSRKHKVKKSTPELLQRELDAQAARFSEDGFAIKAVLLNVTLPG